jgi:hypothetical protein
MEARLNLNVRHVLLAVALLVVLSCICGTAFGDVYDLVGLGHNFSCIEPQVILAEGANGTRVIYTSNTSAKITIDAISTQETHNYSLNIVNNNSGLWRVKLEYFNYSNIDRVNATIILHSNSTSEEQLAIYGGNITQTDTYYDLQNSATIHLGVMNLIENSSEQTTVLQVYLRMKSPNSTVYTLYVITFEFT